MNISFPRLIAALCAVAAIGLALQVASEGRASAADGSPPVSAANDDPHAGHAHHADGADAVTLPGQASIFVCPMHPQIRSQTPGSCPICGMDLVARAAGPRVEAVSVEVDGSLQQALGMRSAPVERRVLSARVRAPAEVMVDQDRIRHVHTRVAGWIEALHVHAEGEPVRAGQVLMALYAPDLVAAQEDYLIALRTGGAGSRAQRAAATRLRVLGVDDSFIDALAQRGSSELRVPVRAPSDGVVTRLDVRHGMYVTPSTVMLEIANLDAVWVRVDVFPEELERLGDGPLYASLRLVGVPDRVWRGQVSYIYPGLDPVARTLQMRVPVPNRRGTLRLGQLMLAELRGEPAEAVLAVPSEAVIRSADGDRVILDQGQGRFTPRAVHAGLRAEGYTQILHGLEEGQQVVVSAQFLLDSEAALRAGLERLGGAHEH
ncbi:efflux RND transporter periplasmic adaptor subunit [Pseudomarimonas salicorniae]|uniref:Efflux RND transporter periplasmic adaptor subunit n=1 Tax=Pseudomarimonas salicorniae TaxID=2933270 RepID=A0ABT0GDK2_9GAMM|nr:efflux RND transporter periplasmic adaptor subunit [Lysobacter sp. CAU 1642]MCK7592513.1 efflux RND transporter periplasmic adaptor subunit [Lysobacter sp. CAU 1642]